MTRLQLVLVTVLAVLTLVVFGPMTWSALLPLASAAGAAVLAAAHAVPAWGWWVVFGLAMSLKCSRGWYGAGGCCRTPRSAADSAPTS